MPFFTPLSDLDGEWSPSMGWRWGGASPSLDLPERQQPMQEKRYSSSTTVTIKRRPDGVCYIANCVYVLH